MSRYRALVIGTAPSLKSSRAAELFAVLGDQNVAITQASDPVAVPAGTWDLVFVLSLDPRPARPLQQWIDLVKAKKVQGRFLVLYQFPVSDEWRKVLDAEIEIGDDHELAESIAYLFEGGESTVADHGVATVVEDISNELDAPDSLSLSLDSSPSELSSSFLDTEGSSDSALSIDGQASEPASLEGHAVAESSSDFDGLDFGSSGDLVDHEELVAEVENTQHPDSDISSPLAGRETFNAEINVDELFAQEEGIETHMGRTFDPAPDMSMSMNDFAEEESPVESPMASSSDISTLQKYAGLKEREAREKEATIQVLKGQVAKLDTKLSRSETERRRLTLSNDEMKTQLSSLEENLSQKQFHIQKVESSHHEEMRGLSLRLDNAIFQASKAQNKLEEFRERVRTDFVKIRAQERELFNKLELQKRDAEALLASKDEQLLNQKREIDRLQYETETLRERLMEETEKAEDRASRLTRAVQSLRLANDMLSGLTEEVLPAASDNFGETKDDDEDAA